MKYHLVRIDPFRAARVAAAMYFLVGLAILPFLYFAFVMAPDGIGFSRGVILLSPFLTSGIGYASTAVVCFVYNWLAGRLGGFEVDLHHQERG
jgi:hypothetical protein